MTGTAERLHELVAVNRAIISTLDYDEVLHLVVERTAELTGADACALLLADESNRVRVAAARGIAREQAATVDAPLDERLNATLRCMLGYREEDDFLGVPVMHHGRIEGLLVVYRRAPSRAEPDEELLVGALADQAAIALEHARRFGEVARISEHQQRLLETIQANTTTALAYLDRELRFVEVNHAYCRVLGRPRDELIGEVHGDIFQEPEVTPILRRVREQGQAVELEEVPVKAPASEQTSVWWDWSARPIRRPDGHVEALVLSAVDVTEKVRSRAQLEAAARRKDEFLAMLAHELRNPLAAIRSAVDILQLRGPGDEQLGARARDAAGRQVEHISRLLDDLLDVSRITRGKIKLEREILDVRNAVEQGVESALPLLRAKKHALSISLGSAPVLVDGDTHRLAQIVSNLVTNAAKYTAAGGHIDVQLEASGDQVEIRVRDDGVGIPPEMLPHVFDLFVQSDPPLDRSQGGLGIGLTLVKRLTEMHGGRVEVSSAGRGQGSEFVVRLPAQLAPAQTVQEDRHPAAGTTSCRRVLLVEDNQDVAEMLAALLRSEGHEVTIADDGPKALHLARERRPDVVLLDIGLPGMDGYEIARRLRREQTEHVPRVVALSGYGRMEDRESAAHAGVDAYLVKPVDTEQLRQVLDQ